MPTVYQLASHYIAYSSCHIRVPAVLFNTVSYIGSTLGVYEDDSLSTDNRPRSDYRLFQNADAPT